ncbi:MAG: hypothetical protein AB1898_30130 [Acidobacteriota bacterium]
MKVLMRNCCSRWVLAGAAILLVFVSRALYGQVYLNSEMPWHEVVLDAQGKLLAWYHPEKNLGYDRFLRLGWEFMKNKVPVDPSTGDKVYLRYAIFNPNTLQGTYWQHNPATTFAHFVDTLVNWYPYSGDKEAIGVVREMLDYQLAFGTTAADWKWPGVPFPTSCGGDKEYGRCIRDMPRDFYGGIEPDKVGEMGLAYVQFYELTGERKYLEAGLQCAKVLAEKVRAGDANHTPWPFRVDARSGELINQGEYGGLVVAPVRLFDELIHLGSGDTAAFKKARDMAWDWILKHPLNTFSQAYDKWTGYYEDIPKDTANENDMNSMMTCYYILARDNPADVDPQWHKHVGHLIDRSRVLLGRGPYFGAWAIDEQLRPDGGLRGAPSEDTAYPAPGGALLGVYGRGCCSRAGLSCRTAQWGAINAMFFEKTRDGQAREHAFRSLNYATYFAASDGKINCCGTRPDNALVGEYWFEDGYADAGRSFAWALGAVPEFAPIAQNHLLRSSTVVQEVKYGEGSIRYRTFDDFGTAVLRLNFKPVQVTAGGKPLQERTDLNSSGYTVQALEGGDYVVRLRHEKAREIAVAGR